VQDENSQDPDSVPGTFLMVFPFSPHFDVSNEGKSGTKEVSKTQFSQPASYNKVSRLSRVYLAFGRLAVKPQPVLSSPTHYFDW
jgi:hypothetical protein